jgi:pimeloyl-ACP methyl ester carboxylesterase
MPFQTINNVPLHYVETGDRAKPSLVFTGSVLFGAEGFDDLVPLLEKDFHIIRIDVHGHGRSGIRIPLSLEEMADDCYDLLVPLGLSKPVWVGHSIGGMLGMRIAYKHPEAFAALVLIATTARLEPQPLRDQIWQLWQAFRAGQRATIADPELPFFFAQAIFRMQPELVRRYRDWIINFQTQRMSFSVFARCSKEPTSPSFCLGLLFLPSRSPGEKIPLRHRQNRKSSRNAYPMPGSSSLNKQTTFFRRKPREVAEAIRGFLGDSVCAQGDRIPRP